MPPQPSRSPGAKKSSRDPAPTGATAPFDPDAKLPAIPNVEGRVVTLEDLSDAMQYRLGMEPFEADLNAELLLDIFGFNDFVVDNVLDPEYRQIFYLLQEEGFLRTNWESTILHDNREWRTHTWYLAKDRILATAEAFRQTDEEEEEDPADVYADVPDDIWSTRKSK